MSRIDEALKRASESPLARGTSGRVVDVPTHGGGDVKLEDYPLEDAHVATSHAVRSTAAVEQVSVSVSDFRKDPLHEIRERLIQNEKLVLSSGPDMVSREQYRRIAATLHDAQAERGLKTLVVTSALPKEGKTLTTINLALTFSESYGRKVLLIDADLRRPSVHHVLQIPNKRGLTEVLRLDRPQIPTVPLSPTLDVLTAGSVDGEPLAGLSSPRMQGLLDHAASRYDWVILDTPPLALLSDAQLVARLSQGVLFVIRAGSTPFPIITRALGAIGRDIVVGTVLNGVESDPGSQSYYGHYDRKDR